MRRTSMLILAALALSAALATAARSDTLVEANLDPFQSVPPHNTPGYGYMEASLNTTSGAFSVTLGNYFDLLGGATSVRVQDAATGVNGPTIFSLTLDNPGATSGTFSGSASPVLTAGQISDMLTGNTYVLITDSVYPSGEIRGQISPAPEPSSLFLFAAGIVGLFYLRRSKQVNG